MQIEGIGTEMLRLGHAALMSIIVTLQGRIQELTGNGGVSNDGGL